MEKFVIITGGGSGSRMQHELPKQFLEVDGTPIIFLSIAAFTQYNPNIHLIITLPKSYFDYWHALLLKHQFNPIHTLVEGGFTRFQSIKNALTFVPKKSLVAIHDAVRPFVSAEVIANAFCQAAMDGSAIPVIPVQDSIRKINTNENIILSREEIYSVQTPQVFWSSKLIDAYQVEELHSFTDDASVYENSKKSITSIEGNRENIKITTPIDLVIANAFSNQLIHHPSFPQITWFKR